MLLSQAASTFSKRADSIVAVTERIKEEKEEKMSSIIIKEKTHSHIPQLMQQNLES